MKSKGFAIFAGILSLLGGLFAWFNPFAATMAAEWLAGWFFLFSGISAVIFAFSGSNTGSRWPGILLGIMMVLMGIFLLANPLQGVLSLTIIIAILLLVAGFGRVMLTFVTPSPARWMVLISGLISLLLAVMIFMNFPQSAAVMLGIFLAVELISNGISLLVLASSSGRKPAMA